MKDCQRSRGATCIHFVILLSRSLLIMVYSDYVKQRILYYRRLGESYQRIVTLLAEGHKVTKPGVFEFCRHFEEMGSIKRTPGTGKKSKFTDEAAQIVERQMQADDKTTSENWQRFFAKKVSTFVQGQPLKVPNSIRTYVCTYSAINNISCLLGQMADPVKFG